MTHLPLDFEANDYRVIILADGASERQREAIVAAWRSATEAATVLSAANARSELIVRIYTSAKLAEKKGAFLPLAPPPEDGPLANLPRTKYVQVFASPDGDMAALQWAGSSRIFWKAQSDEIGLYLADDSDGTLWMLRYFVFNLFASFHRLIPMHSSLVVWQNQFILLAADSGNGKTTAALAAYFYGGRLLVEDVVYMGYSGRVATVPARHFMNVRPRTMMSFPAICGEKSIRVGETLAEERAKQMSVDLAAFRPEIEPSSAVSIGVVLRLSSGGRGRTVMRRSNHADSSVFLRESVPEGPIIWSYLALSKPPLFSRKHFKLPSCVQVFDVSWSIENEHWHRELYQELFPLALGAPSPT
jgi:hypothetical protein